MDGRMKALIILLACCSLCEARPFMGRRFRYAPQQEAQSEPKPKPKPQEVKPQPVPKPVPIVSESKLPQVPARLEIKSTAIRVDLSTVKELIPKHRPSEITIPVRSITPTYKLPAKHWTTPVNAY
jgi:hypothetical protein